jgi:hypothetical protein
MSSIFDELGVTRCLEAGVRELKRLDFLATLSDSLRGSGWTPASCLMRAPDTFARVERQGVE